MGDSCAAMPVRRAVSVRRRPMAAALPGYLLAGCLLASAAGMSPVAAQDDRNRIDPVRRDLAISLARDFMRDVNVIGSSPELESFMRREVEPFLDYREMERVTVHTLYSNFSADELRYLGRMYSDPVGKSAFRKLEGLYSTLNVQMRRILGNAIRCVPMERRPAALQGAGQHDAQAASLHCRRR